MTRRGGRPNQDRIRVTVHISRAGKREVERLAAEKGVTPSEMYRTLLTIGVTNYDEYCKAMALP